MASNNSDTIVTKRKRIVLSIVEKLRVIENLENGVSTTKIMEEFGIARQTVSDIKRSKDKIKAFAVKFDVDVRTSGSRRKKLRLPRNEDLEEAVYKWCVQQRSCGVAVRGTDLQFAAERLAKQLNITNFSANSGWICRFRKRHNISDKNKSVSLAGEKAAIVKEEEWQQADEVDPDYDNHAEEETPVNMCTTSLEGDSENEESYESSEYLEKLSEVRDSLDVVIHFIERTSSVEMQPYDEPLKTLRKIVILKQLEGLNQLKSTLNSESSTSFGCNIYSSSEQQPL